MSFHPPPQTWINDPDDWYGRWLKLHPSALFQGHFNSLALRVLKDQPDGPGRDELRFVEGETRHEVEVRYAVETYPSGARLLHVLSIRSPADPLPDLTDEVEG